MTYKLPVKTYLGTHESINGCQVDLYGYTEAQMQQAYQAGHAHDDTALLRQCLEGYESMTGRKPERIEKLVTALRERLGEKV